MRALLISNSVSLGGQYLDHCFKAIKKTIGQEKEVLFIPYALNDWEGYEKIAQARFKKEGVRLKSIHREKDPRRAIRDTGVLFVGGGNTFRLLKKMQDLNLVNLIGSRVKSGKLIYIGVSAGTNLACPTIRTTNDMPIVEPRSLKALGLVKFQINPHYIDPEKNPKHKIETREERLRQFHEENNLPVVALREGSYLLLDDKKFQLGGGGAKLFEKNKKSRELRRNQLLSFLL